jgi:hypothetical protein
MEILSTTGLTITNILAEERPTLTNIRLTNRTIRTLLETYCDMVHTEDEHHPVPYIRGAWGDMVEALEGIKRGCEEKLAEAEA